LAKQTVIYTSRSTVEKSDLNSTTVANIAEPEITYEACTETEIEKPGSIGNTSSRPNSSKQGGKPSTYCRKFLNKWTSEFDWIFYDAQKDVAYCQQCTEAAQKRLITVNDKESPFINISQSSVGYCNWKKAVERFRVHELSTTHKEAVLKLSCTEQGIHIVSSLNVAKERQMAQARVALLKLFSSLRYLTTQGLAIRGHTDEASNYHNLLLLRSEDCEDVRQWMCRQGVQYQWMSHDVQDEMIEMMTQAVLRIILTKIRKLQYFAIMIDESADVSVREQVSICFRTVEENLDIQEDFVGLYCSDTTDASTLYNIIRDCLSRLGLDVVHCRGQCYDGASNVAGIHTGVQSRLRTDERRAIFVHCYAHSLSLVLQDAIKNVSVCRDALNTMRDIITFVRSSPKRLAWFSTLQTQQVNLRPFCPTRWTLRAASVNSVLDNIEELITFMNEVATSDKGEAGYKANGFAKYLCKFSNYFVLKLLAKVFNHIDAVNTHLQSAKLNFHDSLSSVDMLKQTVVSLRDKADDFFAEVVASAEQVDYISQPSVPRLRRMPKRLEDAHEQQPQDTVELYHRKIFVEIIDTIHVALNSRFETEAVEVLQRVEDFLLHNSKEALNDICSFYGSDIDRCRLALHRDMFFDFTVNSVDNLTQIIQTFSSDTKFACMLPELHKLLRLILTIPVTTCTAERSFSCLRRLKTFLRSTMGQRRLNSVAVMNVHSDIAMELNLDELANEFINRTSVRMNTFLVRK